MKKKGSNQNSYALYDQIRKDLAAHFPTLHLFTGPGGTGAEVRGTFPVLGEGGRVLDTFQVRIKLPPGYPRELPITWETGGRIPWISDRHIDADGTACVLLPDERWRVFPVGAAFLQYLRGPLHSFFLSQVAFETDGKWPFGEWAHGENGVIELYTELLGTSDVITIWRFLRTLAQTPLDLTAGCPCGSPRRVRDCCRRKIEELRRKVPRSDAARSHALVTKAAANALALERIFFGTGPASHLIRYAGRAVSPC